MPKQLTKRVPPIDAPADALERVGRIHGLEPEPGDIVVTREAAGRLTTLSTVAVWRYALRTIDRLGPPRYFSRYDAAASEGERMAAERRVRLFYTEDAQPVLLMDYRSSGR